MNDVTFEGCAYKGGFRGMASTDKATLTLTSDQFILKRPRSFKRSLLKVWAKWTAVRQFDVDSDDDGVLITITTGRLGPGTVHVAGISPMDIWSKMSSVEAFRAHIPVEACNELGVEPAPAAPSDESEATDADDPSSTD